MNEKTIEFRISEAIAKTRAHVREVTPRLFNGTDASHERFNGRGWAIVRDWRPTKEKPWLGLIGATGTCKSRMACLLGEVDALSYAEELVRQSSGASASLPKFAFVSAYEVSEMVLSFQIADFDEKPKIRKSLNALREADTLVIDDVGKGKMNTTVAAELFALIDFRYANLLPTIWTANSTPEQIAATMPQDVAAPFAGRLNDHSRIVRFK